MLVSFLLLLDDTAVAVVLPRIQGDLRLGLSGLEWVVNSYTITLAVLMLLAGKLADILLVSPARMSGRAICGQEQARWKAPCMS